MHVMLQPGLTVTASSHIGKLDGIVTLSKLVQNGLSLC